MRTRNKCLLIGAIVLVLGVMAVSVYYGVRADGGWSDYSEWTKCTESCGQGTKSRTRTCTNPRPVFDGKQCIGRDTDVSFCNTHPCPVHGNWTAHSNWTECSATCGGGTRQRWRTCTNPSPVHGGDHCMGESTENGTCNTQGCPVDGGWSPFGNWTDCNVSCDGGHRLRQRTCTNPPPANGGKNCTGEATEIQQCNEHNCPINGGWSKWSPWRRCSTSCGRGMQSRYRKCDDSSANRNGTTCIGHDMEPKRCFIQLCPDDVHGTHLRSAIPWIKIGIGIGAGIGGLVVVLAFSGCVWFIVKSKRTIPRPSGSENIVYKVPQENHSTPDAFHIKIKA